MRNRNAYKTIIIFVLLLTLAIGYAVVSSVNLSIAGTVTTDTYLNVIFSGKTSVSDSNKVVTSISSSQTEATVIANDLLLNETVTADFEITNDESVEDAIVTIEQPASNDYYKVEVITGEELAAQKELDDSHVMMIADSDVGHIVPSEPSPDDTTDEFALSAGESMVVRLKITLIKLSENTSDRTYNYSFSLIATPASTVL